MPVTAPPDLAIRALTTRIESALSTVNIQTPA